MECFFSVHLRVLCGESLFTTEITENHGVLFSVHLCVLCGELSFATGT